MIKTLPFYILVLLALGCNSPGNIPGEFEPITSHGLIKNQSITISGLERAYHLYLPPKPDNAPLVVLLHGNKGSYNQILGLTGRSAPQKVWLEVAQKENIILVIPNGSTGTNGSNGWNDCRSDVTGNPNTNDLKFIDELIDFVLDNYQGNSSRVFVVGTSNGGHMAMRLAQEIPTKLKAFAAIVASKPVNSDCTNSTIPISALIMNGTEDPIVPYEGGQMLGNRGEVYSSEETIEYWIARNQTETQPQITDLPNINRRDKCKVQKQLFSNGANGTEVVFYKIIGGGHTVPSKTERYKNAIKWIVKEQNGDIELAHEVWDFFKEK